MPSHLALLMFFLASTMPAEASRGKALDDLCHWLFTSLGFSPATADFLSGATAVLFLVAVLYVVYRQNRSAGPDE